MGRPTKVQAQRKALGKDKDIPNDPFEGLSDGQVLSMIHDRFDVMHRMVQGSLEGAVRGFIVSGAPGVGKTYNVETAVENRHEEMDNFRSTIIKGAITPIHLYMTLYNYQHPGNVIVLDDADSIFFHDDGVSLLKAALDSSPRRILTWASESSALKTGPDPDDRIPSTFEYKGTMIFITNTDFQGIVDKGKSRLTPHMEALLSRSMYLDLKIHNRRAIALWVNYLVKTKKILQVHLGLTEDQEKQAVDWVLEHKDDLRTLSIREALKVGQLMKADYNTWELDAEVLLLKEMQS